MALNKNIVRAFDCFLVGVLGNAGISLALFHLKVLSVVDSLLVGTVVGALMGLTLAALFWGKL